MEANGMMNIRPLYDRIVVKRIEEQETTRNGIVIPDSAKEKPQEGEVMAIGQGKRLDGGELVALGPRGRNVVLEKKYGGPTITKDGVTVAKEIDLKDPLENMGAQMVREVASKTSDVAGDGTTTATILAQAIYREGVKAVTAGANPMAIKRG